MGHTETLMLPLSACCHWCPAVWGTSVPSVTCSFLWQRCHWDTRWWGYPFPLGLQVLPRQQCNSFKVQYLSCTAKRENRDYQTTQNITFSILLWLILRSRRERGRLGGMLVKLLCCRYKRSSPSNFKNALKWCGEWTTLQHVHNSQNPKGTKPTMKKFKLQLKSHLSIPFAAKNNVRELLHLLLLVFFAVKQGLWEGIINISI